MSSCANEEKSITVVSKMKPSSDSKSSGIKSPAMRKLARVRSSSKSANTAATDSDSAVKSSEVVEAAATEESLEGAVAGPADSLRLPKTLSRGAI